MVLSRAGDNRQGIRERKFSARRANVELILPILQLPLLSNNIPAAEITTSQGERDLGRATGRDLNLFESAELLNRASGNTDIDLGYFGTGFVSGVAQSGGNGSYSIPQVNGATLLDSTGRISGNTMLHGGDMEI